MVLISVVLTIIVLNFHFRGPKKQRVPKWMRKYIIGYIGRLFCFKTSTTTSGKLNQNNVQNYKKMKLIDSNSSNKTKLILKSPNDDENSEITDYISTKNQPAYLKTSNRSNKISNNQNQYANNNQIILEYSSSELMNDLCYNNNNSVINEYHNTISSNTNNLFNSNSYKLNSKSAPNDISLSYSNNEDDLIQNKPFSNEMCKNLEKMLNKMQKSFDPFKLKDENLKFAILKEILECQRLLLTYNLFNNQQSSNNSSEFIYDKDYPNNNNNTITINEIYDEWKILAMVVDRICFVFYLLALIISSILFIVSEQDLFDVS